MYPIRPFPDVLILLGLHAINPQPIENIYVQKISLLVLMEIPEGKHANSQWPTATSNKIANQKARYGSIFRVRSSSSLPRWHRRVHRQVGNAMRKIEGVFDFEMSRFQVESRAP